jgi:hypothetical protein
MSISIVLYAYLTIETEEIGQQLKNFDERYARSRNVRSGH